MQRSSSTARRLALFFLLTFATTGALHGAMIVGGIPFSLAPSSPALHLYLLGLAAPTLVAIALTQTGARAAFLRTALTPAVPASSYVYALGTQAVLVAAAWVLLAVSGSGLAPRPALAPGFALIAVGQLVVVFGEELGWRGFALPRLVSLTSPLASTLVLAIAWGVWHAPMFFVPGSLQAAASPQLFAASILAWSAVHTLLYLRSRPSIVPNLVFHASANLTLNLGLVTPELEPYLLAVYLSVAAFGCLRLRSLTAA